MVSWTLTSRPAHEVTVALVETRAIYTDISDNTPSRFPFGEVSIATDWIVRRRSASDKVEHNRTPGARDAYSSVFQGLAHHFQHVAGKLRKFIQEEHAVVRE
jgi:hypothetical protein